MNLKTSYMGVALKNPIIIGSCSIVTDIEKAKKLEAAGAAAIVYKSLFEEQLQLEAAEMEDDLNDFNDRNAEMLTLFPKIEHSGPKAHLLALKKLKESVSIPVFASLNCLYEVSWVDYAKNLEATGIDGLELNFYATLGDGTKSPIDIEKEQIEILKKVKSALKIPVAVKLSPFYTNTFNFVKELDNAGANEFVLFNRLFQPVIDVEHEELITPYNLSSKGDYRLPLRYAGLLSGNIKAGICGNTGIMDADDAIAMILAGASSVQVVSTVYKNGVDHVTKILEGMSTWMAKKGYNSIDDFKGKLSRANIKEPHAYKRAQYVDLLMKSKEFVNKYPVQ